MRTLFRPKKSQQSNENNDKEGYNSPKRLYSRNKTSSHVVPSPILDISNRKHHTRIARIRLVFIRIGDIDTLNEKYQADVYYEAKWIDKLNTDLLELSSEEKIQLSNENCTIRMSELDPKLHWTPQLFIENAIGQIGEQEKWFTIKKITGENLEAVSLPIVNLHICEHRRIRGVFWEKLELNHFPADVQDLTVSITTHHHIENCMLIQDEEIRSSINREAFIDQQEWNLYEHVATESKQTKEEHSFEDEDCVAAHKKHSVLAVTCRAARRPGYYYWNGFCLIFLITVCSFCIFSIPPDLPQSRLQITCTLLLTSITFRWVVNRSLPTISYLTTLDQYAIISIIMLVLLCVWHSVIATIVFLNPDTTSLKAIGATNIYVKVDRYIFICMFSIYILIHIALIIWLICVPYKRRREMEYLDREYGSGKHIYLNTSRTRCLSSQTHSQDLVFRRTSSIHGKLPIIQSPTRSTRHPDGVIMIPNAATFLPIREELNESATKTINTFELHEQDDVFYDHTNDINNELKYSQIQPIQNS